MTRLAVASVTLASGYVIGQLAAALGITISEHVRRRLEIRRTLTAIDVYLAEAAS